MSENSVILRNVGNGTAINISIRPIYSKTNTTIKDEDIDKFTYNLACLRQREEVLLPLKNGVWDGLGIIETPFGEATFIDIQGNKYKETLKDIGNEFKYDFPNNIKEQEL